jgi:Tfp pilus assembly ATPase PilU
MDPNGRKQGCDGSRKLWHTSNVDAVMNRKRGFVIMVRINRSAGSLQGLSHVREKELMQVLSLHSVIVVGATAWTLEGKSRTMASVIVDSEVEILPFIGVGPSP